MDVADPLAVAERLRRRLKQRALTFGAWISIGHPEIASIFAGARGDFVGFDLEHTTIDFATAQQIIRACHEFGRACLPRIGPGNLEQLSRLLDAGADGVVVPQVQGRDDIERVVDALRYPPAGRRSFGVAAAHQYGRAFDAYVRSANASLSLIVQVETIGAVEQVKPIVAHPDVDGVMVGPYDLSGSLGIPGKLSDPRVTEAAGRVVTACASAGKSCGTHLVRPSLEGIRRHLADGFTFLVLGSDVFNLAQRSEELDAMIEACHADR
ncbi:MAG: 4-hydroxy-2-oxovalerate aldolase [Candidatus Omnitrophica bacterium]|nr:4-hydroxy-2-oxovalerate aldolase [Candidatus Omnitrophota bacterium]MBI3021834.1 4-hydroxy-2-oxovalerate aldolase [Candidatus Omnitrophota bacterium]